MTSHPKDLSDELIEVMRHSKKICKHLHLPVQSGSTEILKKMNRHYTKEQYLELSLIHILQKDVKIYLQENSAKAKGTLRIQEKIGQHNETEKIDF